MLPPRLLATPCPTTYITALIPLIQPIGQPGVGNCSIRLEGPTEFKGNRALWGAAIANRMFPGEFSDYYTADTYKTPTITYPDGTIFEDNGGLVSCAKLVFSNATCYMTSLFSCN